MNSNLKWRVTSDFESLKPVFGHLDAIFKLQGQFITRDKISDVIRVKHQDTYYYVKRYYSAGKGLRRFFGKPRIQGEWENLQWFERFNIPTARIVAYGYERQFGLFKRGAMITQEILGSQDLASIASRDKKRFHDREWVKNITSQLAAITKKLHQNRFIHNDLKWRNILVDTNNRIYLIDCPLGGFWRGRLLHYRIIKDIKCLDHFAKSTLSRTQRLDFYKNYANVSKLAVQDKQFIREMLNRRSRRYDEQQSLWQRLIG
jgi:tRNA A-37 threonylcarbamoyl transferase component Bud32